MSPVLGNIKCGRRSITGMINLIPLSPPADLGTMGFELPAAMGVKVGNPEKSVWCIAGDGSFQMTLHELATLVQDKIAVKIAIMNNGYLGMVRQWQELFWEKRYSATPL